VNNVIEAKGYKKITSKLENEDPKKEKEKEENG
jgi:hypothetical protein